MRGPGGIGALALAGLLALASCGGDEPSPTPPASEKVLKVGDRALGKEEFERFLMREIGVSPDEIEPSVADGLYEEFFAEVLLARAAARENFEVDEKALAREVQRLTDLEPGSEPEELQVEARRHLLAQLYEERVLGAEITVAPEEVDARMGKDGPHRFRNQMMFRQIIVPDRKTAEAVLRRVVRKGEPFDAVAREVSTGPDRGSVQQAPLVNLPPKVADVLRRLPEGKISRPVEVGGSYYLFQLDAKNRLADPGRTLERERVEHQIYREKLEKLRAERLAELAGEEGVRAPVLAARESGS